MICNVENGRLIIENNGNTYSFEAHADAPRPSLGNISAGGKHWSDRDPDVKLERHTGIQDVTISDKYAAWYTQEFIPDGVDYKVTKNAKIYLGVLDSGETREIYKGECYGDLVLDGDELYFNMGNKAAVISIVNGECRVLFKHSGIKKNGIDMRVTPKRILFTHWTKDNNYIMVYDRVTGEVSNPHADTGFFDFLDEDTVIYQSTDFAWKLDLNTLKKKRFFTAKQIEAIRLAACEYFGLPQEYYIKDFYVKFRELRDGRLHFLCKGRGRIEGLGYCESNDELYKQGYPEYISAEYVCDEKGKNGMFPVKKEDIKKELLHGTYNDLEYMKWKASSL